MELVASSQNGIAMNNHRPPTIGIELTELPTDPKERHEVLVDIFGRYLLWLRKWAVDATRQLTESEEARQKLGPIHGRKYETLSTLTTEQQELVCNVSEATVDRFIQLFVTLLAGTGVDQRLSDDHAIRFRLDMEICDVETMSVVEQVTLNRGGKKIFADYWMRWINQYASKQ